MLTCVLDDSNTVRTPGIGWWVTLSRHVKGSTLADVRCCVRGPRWERARAFWRTLSHPPRVVNNGVMALCLFVVCCNIFAPVCVVTGGVMKFVVCSSTCAVDDGGSSLW